MFLQAGGFAKPQKIFSTGDSMPQGMWVDSNTHAHANWVFTEPGVHRVALGIRAKQADGKVLSGTKIVTFAVGVDAQEALSAGWQGEVPKTSAADDAATGSANGNSQGTEGNGDGQGKDSAAENSADLDRIQHNEVGTPRRGRLASTSGYRRCDLYALEPIRAPGS